LAVADLSLRVRGIVGLRIAVMPTVMAGNNNGQVIAMTGGAMEISRAGVENATPPPSLLTHRAHDMRQTYRNVRFPEVYVMLDLK
jgi:hypothetical protein